MSKVQPKVIVRLIEAKDLPPMDISGTTDGCVEFVLDKTAKRSKVIKKSLNPVWNEVFEFDVTNPDGILYCNILDWDLLSKCDLVATVVVTFNMLLQGDNDLWLPLPKKGALHVLVTAIGCGHVQQQQQSFQSIQQSFQPIQQQFQQVSQQFQQGSLQNQQFHQGTQQIQGSQQGQFQQSSIQNQQFNPMMYQQGSIQNQQFQGSIQQGSIQNQQYNPMMQVSQQFGQMNLNPQGQQQHSFQQPIQQPIQTIHVQTIIQQPIQHDAYLFCDYIYGLRHDGKYDKVSLEGGWNKSYYACWLGHLIVVVDKKTHHLVTWNPTTLERKTLSIDDWSTCKGLVEVKGKLYAICKDIYEIDHKGGYEQVTDDGDWDCCVACMAHHGKIWIVSKKGPLYSVHPSNGKWEEESEDDWGEARGIHVVGGKIYLMCSFIYEFIPGNVDEDDGYEERSRDDKWNSASTSTVWNGTILAVCHGHHHGKTNASLVSWHPKGPVTHRLNDDEWENCSTVIGK
jgi:hypothetical protein